MYATVDPWEDFNSQASAITGQSLSIFSHTVSLQRAVALVPHIPSIVYFIGRDRYWQFFESQAIPIAPCIVATAAGAFRDIRRITAG